MTEKLIIYAKIYLVSTLVKNSQAEILARYDDLLGWIGQFVH